MLLTCALSHPSVLVWTGVATAQEPAATRAGDAAPSESSAQAPAAADVTPSASSEAVSAAAASTEVESPKTESGASEPAASEPAASEPAAPPAAPSDVAGLPELGKLSYAPHIREIFAAHCSECHGEKTAKAELRVDDRESLMSYVAPGDLESSSLWADYLATTDTEMRMPPVKYGKPLSPLELAAIRVWIEDGAEWPDNIAPEVTALAFVKRETFEPAAYHCLWIGAAGAIAASFAGWAFADIRGYGDFWSTHWDTDLIARHRISGIAVTAAALLLVMVATLARRRTSSDLRFVWLAGALVLAGLVSLVGHQGGELTYGEELFSRAYEQSFGDLQPTAEPQTAAAHTAATKVD